MPRISDLNVTKDQDIATQRAVLDHLTASLMPFAAQLEELRDDTLADGVLDLSQEGTEQLIRYLLITLIAADIATVPYPEGRARYMARLTEIADHYGVVLNRILYLTRHADALLARLEEIEKRSV